MSEVAEWEWVAALQKGEVVNVQTHAGLTIVLRDHTQMTFYPDTEEGPCSFHIYTPGEES